MNNRIYSYYSDNEISLIQEHADSMSLSLSAFQKYQTLLRINDRKEYDLNTLIDELKINLENFEKNRPFIISSLLPGWTNYTKDTKIKLGMVLKRIVSNNKDNYEIRKLSGNINQYKKV